MNWRHFKVYPEGNKVAAVATGGEPGGFATAATLIPPAVNLKSKDTDSGGNLYRLLVDAHLEINAAGWPWPEGWKTNLSSRDRRRIVEFEQQLDSCCSDGDRPGLLAALAGYRDICLQCRGVSSQE